MSIIEALLHSLPSDKTSVRGAYIGLHWTVVCSQGCGMASTLAAGVTPGYNPLKDAGQLHKREAHELAQLAKSDNLLEASIGVASINSLLINDLSDFSDVNGHDILINEGRGKNVAVIGHFPFVTQLSGLSKNLWVIEKNPQPGDYPAELAAEIIPQADFVAITGTTIINHTLEKLLSYCRPEQVVMVLGPSTPLSPILFNYGITILSGTYITSEADVIRLVCQGATFQQIQGARHVTLYRPGYKSSQ